MDKERAKQVLKTPGLITSALAVLGLSVLFAMIALIYFNPAFGWFAKNTLTDASGMGLEVSRGGAMSFSYAEPSGGGWGADTPLADNGSADILRQLHKPGDSYTFRLTATNSSRYNLSVGELGFVRPTPGTDEVPVTENAVNYYFGTQVTATVLAVNGADVVDPVAVPLLTLSEGQPVYTDILLYEFNSAPTLAPGDSVTFVIRIDFVNLNESQDVYQNFGVENGVCQRRFFLQ